MKQESSYLHERIAARRRRALSGAIAAVALAAAAIWVLDIVDAPENRPAQPEVVATSSH